MIHSSELVRRKEERSFATVRSRAVHVSCFVSLNPPVGPSGRLNDAGERSRCISVLACHAILNPNAAPPCYRAIKPTQASQPGRGLPVSPGLSCFISTQRELRQGRRFHFHGNYRELMDTAQRFELGLETSRNKTVL